MKYLITIGLMVAFAGGVAADTVLFKDDLELSGDKVEVVREHEKGVDVKVSHGTITILWPRIKSITIDYDTHLASMRGDGRDTPRGLLDFVKVLLRHDMNKEAAEVAGVILAKNKVAEDILLEIGTLMQAEKQWGLAKKAFEMFLRVNPSRRDIMKRLDDVSKHVKEPANGGGAVVKQPDDKQPVKQPDDKQPVKQPKKDDPKPPGVLEGLEAESDWVMEAWGNKAEAEVVTQGTKVKNKVLGVTYHSADKQKAAARLGGTWDLTRQEFLVFDVWNAGKKSVGLSVAFNTMPGWKFFESTSKSIRPNAWVTIKIALDRKRFKCEGSNWRNTSELKNRDNVKQIILMIYNAGKEGVIYFDNIRLIAAAGAPPAK
jgi:hypothetical protein